MKVTIVGYSKKRIDLTKYIPTGTELIICDNMKGGMFDSVKEFAGNRGLKYAVYNLETVNVLKTPGLPKLEMKKGEVPEFLRNDRLVKDGDLIILFGTKDTPYILYITHKCRELNKKLQIVDLSKEAPAKYKKDKD